MLKTKIFTLCLSAILLAITPAHASAPHAKQSKKQTMAKKGTKKSGRGLASAKTCEDQRAFCGSLCNEKAGDNEKEWKACFDSCKDDCDPNAQAEDTEDSGNKGACAAECPPAGSEEDCQACKDMQGGAR